MADANGTLTITLATRERASELYRLAGSALTLDRFSESLLDEKLFASPRPGVMDFRVYVAERDGRGVGFMQSVVCPETSKAWLGLFAVTHGLRRQGIGRALFETVRSHWADAGAGEAEVLAIPGNYFHPGLDPRYTSALAFVEQMGFERFKDCVNLTAFLRERFDTAADEDRLARHGVEIRRAAGSDGLLLDAFFAKEFGADWRFEAGLAMRSDPPSLHLAVRDGEIIAFSAHSSQNREWGFFGPMGTTPACRGLGVGRVLLRRCLNDMRDAGHETSVIPWVGPIGFYSRYCDCVVDRVFWRYRFVLPGADDAPSPAER